MIDASMVFLAQRMHAANVDHLGGAGSGFPDGAGA
jgi:hypothetical protein